MWWLWLQLVYSHNEIIFRHFFLLLLHNLYNKRWGFNLFASLLFKFISLWTYIEGFRYHFRSWTIQPGNDTTTEITKIFYGSENVIRKVSQFISNSKSKLDACIDHTRPLLILEPRGIKDSIIDARDKGIKHGLSRKLQKTIFLIAKCLLC